MTVHAARDTMYARLKAEAYCVTGNRVLCMYRMPIFKY